MSPFVSDSIPEGFVIMLAFEVMIDQCIVIVDYIATIKVDTVVNVITF